jgi:hypothetical protein
MLRIAYALMLRIAYALMLRIAYALMLRIAYALMLRIAYVLMLRIAYVLMLRIAYALMLRIAYALMLRIAYALFFRRIEWGRIQYAPTMDFDDSVDVVWHNDKFMQFDIGSYFRCFQPVVVCNATEFIEDHLMVFDDTEITFFTMAAYGDKVQSGLCIIIFL